MEGKNYHYIENPYEPRWISVKERLPEINKPVLCWTKETYGEHHVICNLLPDGRFREATGEEYSSYNVTQWQELPEPPKGEDDGDNS